MVKKEKVGNKKEAAPMIEKKERGPWLTTWLVLIIVFDSFVLLGSIFILNDSTLLKDVQTVGVAPWLIYVSAVIAVIDIILAIFLFNWKKWAFYGYCANAVIMLISNLVGGDKSVSSILISILGLLGPVVLYLFMKPKWNLFK